MTIDPIEIININEVVNQSVDSSKTKSADFSEWLAQQGIELNDQLNTADVEIRKLASGESANIHEVLLTIEKAKLSFDLAAQVRNKMLEGYQEILRMQV